MSRFSLAAFAMIFLSFAATAQAKEMALDSAPGQYAAALERSAQLANKALPLIQGIDKVNEAAEKAGTSPKQYLDPKEYKEYDKARSELHKLYSLQAFENSFTRDIAVLNKLYETSLKLHGMRAQYVIETGTAAGFDKALEERMKSMPKQERFYVKLLKYIEKLVPAESAPSVE